MLTFLDSLLSVIMTLHSSVPTPPVLPICQFIDAVQGIEPRALHMLSKHYHWHLVANTTKAHMSYFALLLKTISFGSAINISGYPFCINENQPWFLSSPTSFPLSLWV